MNRAFIDRIIVCSAVAFLMVTPALAQNIKLENSTQSTAGGSAQSASFNLIATVGQSSPPGNAGSTQFALSGGFIATIGNSAPTVMNAITNQTLTLGATAFTRDLNASPAVFSDPDGNALTYAASSSATNIATANISGSTLTVAAVAVGTATITVNADDKNGGTASTSFSVTVTTTMNRSPAVANIISNVALTVGGASFTRNLNAAPVVFNDPDGDSLSYIASTSAGSVATASISVSTLTVAPVSAGTATITVTANDNKGGTVSTTFTVTVNPAANRPPVVANAIPNRTLTLGGAPFTRDLSISPAVFFDPDGDALTYSATSSAANIATASISGSTLTVASVAVGNATITMTANDNRGGTVSSTFTVTVGTAVNRAPTVANAISNVTLTAGGASFVRDLNAALAVFNDPDGDPLSYTASTSAGSVATASISISTLTVAPVSAGSATITVTANDNRGGTAATTFAVTVNPSANQSPVILPTAITTPQPIGPINIRADVTDDRGVAAVTLSYRAGGVSSFSSLPMTVVSGNTYQAIIPTSDSRGVEYFITAKDEDNAETRMPAAPQFFSISILITSEAKPNAQPAAVNETSYRLISVPFQLADASALTVLQDDLGSYVNTAWRLIGLDAGQPISNKRPYVEVSQSGTFTPGKSFFLIVKESKTVDAGPGQSIKTDQEYSITLLPGHNFVASPFNFDIPISKLRLSSGRPISLQTFTGTWTPVTNAISPWEGYYLPNNDTSNDVLLVNPNLSASSQPRVAETDETGNWRLQISAACGEARDTYNFAGIASASNDNYDDNDLVEPPPIGDFVSVYFSHPEWQKLFERYTDDMHAAASANHRWNFSVETNIPNETAALKFDGLQKVAAELSVFLVDEELNYKQDLRQHAVYQYQPRRLDRAKEFTLIVGKNDFVVEQTAPAQGVPADFVLEQNFPNPFNPETAIRFGLPEKSEVTIKILDLSGRAVATVLDRVELPAGRHQRTWNGRDDQGRAVVSGIYFYQMQVGSVVKKTMKLTLLK